MTGARPDTTQVWDLNTHFRKDLPDVVTLPQHFKNAGYFVQGMGKIYHGGFDDPPTWSVPWTAPDAPKSAPPPNAGTGAKRKRGPAFFAGGTDESWHDGALATQAVETLGTLKDKEAPFFLAVGFAKPHLAFACPQKYWDLYDPDEIPLAPNRYLPKDAPDYALVDSGELRNYDGAPKEGPFPEAYARRLKHGYYAAVSFMDAQVGRVLDELDRLGLTENTIVVLWGDHGWKLGEHDRWCKHSNAENDTNAPLIVSAPGMIAKGKHTKALVEFVDIYPTLAELAGLPLPDHLEGTSAVPLLADPDKPWKQAAFSQYPRNSRGKRLMGYSMRTSRYRFTCWVDREDHTKIDAIELYDHETDPQENQNLAGDPAHQETVRTLMAQWKEGWKGARL